MPLILSSGDFRTALASDKRPLYLTDTCANDYDEDEFVLEQVGHGRNGVGMRNSSA